MQKIYKKDLKFSVIAGLITGFIVWKLTIFLNIPELFNISYIILIPLIPVIWFAGVNLGYFLGIFFKPFNQFGKFVAVGFTNAAVDFGILNLAIYWSGVSAGLPYSLFKAVSFLVAMFNSYAFNKYWTFEAGKSKGGSSELAQFASVAVLSVLVNVGVASLVVNFIDPIGGLNSNGWANVGAVAGSAAALVFSFIGFRRVFKK